MEAAISFQSTRVGKKVQASAFAFLRARAQFGFRVFAESEWLRADGFLQIRHLHRGQRRLEAFVAHLQPGAVDGLFKRLTGEDAKGMGNAGFLRRLSDAAGDLVDDDVIVGGVAAQETAQTDDRVILPGLGESAGGGGNFEGAGNSDDGDVFLPGAGSNQSVIGATQQPFGNELIEPGNDNSEPETSRVQFACDCLLANFLFVGFLRDSVSPW